jgi:hypothetical protein
MSSDDSKSKFREEHLDWSDKIEHYRQGSYTRIYPDYSYELIQKPISVGDDVYYPVLLDDSHNYNKESSQQSNCVKTYIGKCSSVIVSLRKGDIDSDKRATIEDLILYKLRRGVKMAWSLTLLLIGMVMVGYFGLKTKLIKLKYTIIS